MKTFIESNLRKVGDPFSISLTESFSEYLGYFDVGIGTVNFSLSVLVRDTGEVTVELFYGSLSLGLLGPMNGIGSVSGTLTTVGDYTSNPGPFLTVVVKGKPISGYSRADATLNLRVDGTFVVPESYSKYKTTRAPWMEFLTSSVFRAVSTVSLPLNCVNEFVIVTTQPPWSFPGTNEGTTTPGPGTTTTVGPTVPPMTTQPPTFPPIITTVPPDVQPPDPPDPVEPALVLNKASVWTTTLTGVESIDWTDDSYNFITQGNSPFSLRLGQGAAGTPADAAVKSGIPAEVSGNPSLAYYTLEFE